MSCNRKYTHHREARGRGDCIVCNCQVHFTFVLEERVSSAASDSGSRASLVPAVEVGRRYRVRQTCFSSVAAGFLLTCLGFLLSPSLAPRCTRTDGGRFTASPLSLRPGLHLRPRVSFTRIVLFPSSGCAPLAHSLFSKASGTHESCVSESRHGAMGELRVRAQGTVWCGPHKWSAGHIHLWWGPRQVHLHRSSSRAGGHSGSKDTCWKQTHVPASLAPHGCARRTRVWRTSAGLPPTPDTLNHSL